MQQYYADYSPLTAKDILEAIPEAYLEWVDQGGRWGPGIIAGHTLLKARTVGSYLRAFWLAGLKQICGPNGEKIIIPYKPRSKVNPDK